MTPDGTINIMMLGGAKRVSMGRMLIEAGSALRHKVNIFSYELNPHVPIASIGKVIIGKRWTDSDILADIHKCVSEFKIDIILPFVDPAILIARQYCDTFADAWSPLSSADSIETTADKLKTQKAMAAHGIPMPHQYKPDSELPSGFPIIGKPAYGSASRGLVIINTIEEYQNHIATTSEPYIYQQYIDNREEISVDAYVAADGRVLAAIPRRRIEIVGGEVSRTKTISDTEIERMSHKAINALSLRGPITLQFIRDLSHNGNLFLLEINPRFGGGAVCSIYAGAPLPYFLLSEFLKLPVSECLDWQSGVEICRYMQEVVFYNK